ncbi:MAG: lysophospholipid acyltransferase family protein, partial [Vicinamibacterales bacterium]
AAFLVRDVADAFRGATEVDDQSELAWGGLIDREEPGPALRALLQPRRLAAFFLFGVARALVGSLVRPEVKGLEHLPRRGPFIISPNHQSYIDPFVLVGVLPFGVFRQLFFVGAAEYFQTNATAWLARRFNIVPVDPDANLLPAMQAGAFGLKHGKVLVLFPEGERSIDGGVKKFKKGAAILSRHLGVPIVPVAISGMFEIWPRNRPLDWRRLLPWRGHRAHVELGPPMPPPVPSRSDAEHALALRAAVERMWLRSTRSSAERSA